MEEKIKLSFMNDGKPFIVPYMSVLAQENLLDDMVKLENKYKDNKKKYTTEANKYALLRVLQTVDKNVTIKDINSMHADDYMKLSKMITDNSAGELSESSDRKFRNKETKKE